MVTTALETGASPPPTHKTKTFMGKFAYVVGLGCCMHERKSKPPNTSTAPPLTEIKHGDVNWSTSTLGLEADLTSHMEPLRSNSGEIPPLSSFEVYAPPSLSPPPRAAHPQSRPRRHNLSGAESPVLTCVDEDIAARDITCTPTSTSSLTDVTQVQTRSSRKSIFRKSKNKTSKASKDNDEKLSTIKAWGQIDPLYDMYQQQRDLEDRPSRLQNGAGSNGGSRFDDIRAFDFMSYGAWNVI